MILKFVIFNILFCFIRFVIRNKILPKLIVFVKKKLIDYIANNAIKYLSIS